MARPLRIDPPGSWYHVLNRAIARRSIFEDRKDVRYFLAGVARAVRRGELEVHAYCVMTTHYHMLVRSPVGKLSEAMRRIQNTYARYFNRERRRDGPLFRGRFVAKGIDSLTYRRAVLSYIDANPVHAGICPEPWNFPWGSARQYVTEGGPPWLHREWVEGVVAECTPSRTFDPRMYPGSGDGRQRACISRLVDARLNAEGSGNELDSLIGMASPETREWLRRKSLRADGPADHSPYVDAFELGEAIQQSRLELGEWAIRPSRKTFDAWSVLHAGLLRLLACATNMEIAKRLNVTGMHARRLAARHAELIASDNDYASRAAAVTSRLMEGYRRVLAPRGDQAVVVIGE